MGSDSGEIGAITIINDNSVSSVCIFILFNPLSSCSSQMTFKGPGTRSGGSPRPDAWAPSPRRVGGGGGERELGWGRPARAPGQVPKQAPPPDHLAERKPPPQPYSSEPAQLQLRTGRTSLLKPLEMSNGYTTPTQRRRAGSLTAHPPAPPVSPSSSHHSTLLCPRLL